MPVGELLGGDERKRRMATVYVDVIFKDENGNVVGKLVANEKTFASGSRGFHAQGKIELDGKRYQCQAQLVEIGSKPSKEQGTGDKQ